MAAERFPSNDAKPVVRIFTTEPVPEQAVRYILWGLEEEGVPAELQTVPIGATEILAKQAADSSRLNVGIGINGTALMAVLHHRDLPGEKPLFFLTAEEFQAAPLRRLGANAARLVKAEPLVFKDEPLPPPETESFSRPLSVPIEAITQPPEHQGQDQLEELIIRVVTEILNHMEK
ncbi:MAG: glycerol dehydratase reactivase beta/small subunit family protein [Desulfosarcina sp.]|nr:glycerol dehydratase reactivase beta/small subunit family protein [Desulfosarcina sp.]